jgi:hypothetical protein
MTVGFAIVCEHSEKYWGLERITSNGSVPMNHPKEFWYASALFLSAAQQSRARIFHVCSRAASSRTSITTHIFTTVIKLWQGVEMNSIISLQ